MKKRAYVLIGCIILGLILFLLISYTNRKEGKSNSQIDYYYKIAKEKVKLKEFEAAEKNYRQIIALKGENAFVCNELGMLMKQQSKYDIALEYLDRAIKFDTLDFVVYNNRGSVNEILGKTEDAEIDYSKAIEINPEYSPAYNSRGYLHFTKHEFEMAIEDYSKAIKFDSTYFIAYSGRANAYYALHKYSFALSDINRSIKYNNKFGKAYVNRGIIKYQLQDYNGACEDWKSSVQLGERDGEKYLNAYCK